MCWFFITLLLRKSARHCRQFGGLSGLVVSFVAARDRVVGEGAVGFRYEGFPARPCLRGGGFHWRLFESLDDSVENLEVVLLHLVDRGLDQVFCDRQRLS